MPITSADREHLQWLIHRLVNMGSTPIALVGAGRTAARHQRARPLRGHLDALDSAGRFDALHQGHLAERLERLRRLPREQLLPAAGLGNLGTC